MIYNIPMEDYIPTGSGYEDKDTKNWESHRTPVRAGTQLQNQMCLENTMMVTKTRYTKSATKKNKALMDG